MQTVKVGKKVWVTIDEISTNTFLTRSEARANKAVDGILVEVPLSLVNQNKLQKLVNQLALSAGVI